MIPERFLHVDMDAFFVEVERLRRPELVGSPVVVGGLGDRGVVASASYEARAAGVRSAMPMAQARRRCPNAHYLPPDHGAYREMSGRVFAVFETITPYVEHLSVDEAFLDIAGLTRHLPDAAAVADHVRDRVREETGLPASAGAAAVKFLAKLASARAKPAGSLVIPAGEELQFLHPLPVRELWGVGEATHASLEGLGVVTIGDLAQLPPALLESRLGPALGRHLHDLSWGRDARLVETEGGVKSVSVEETYAVDLVTGDAIDAELVRLCDRLAHRLHKSSVAGRTVTIKVRFADFETITRSHTEQVPVMTAPALLRSARRLIASGGVDGTTPVRLLGVGASGLVAADAPVQLDLGGSREIELAEAVEAVRARFGAEAVGPARLRRDPPHGAKNT